MMEIIRMVVVLSVITGLSGFILSTIKVATEPIIEEQVLANVQGPALKQVLLQATNDPIADRKPLVLPGSEQKVLVFPSLKDGKLQAVAIEGAGSGYGGDVNVIVGFDINADKVLGISVTTHKETPGLGSRVQENAFTKQFKSKDPAKATLKKDGGDIDAISGVTVSSGAVTDAVKQASGWYSALKDTIKTTW
jgi:electron transport complex protein RnfG